MIYQFTTYNLSFDICKWKSNIIANMCNWNGFLEHTYIYNYINRERIEYFICLCFPPARHSLISRSRPNLCLILFSKRIDLSR